MKNAYLYNKVYILRCSEEGEGGTAADGGRPEFASGSPGIVRETFARPFCSRFGGGVYTQHVYT